MHFYYITIKKFKKIRIRHLVIKDEKNGLLKYFKKGKKLYSKWNFSL